MALVGFLQGSSPTAVGGGNSQATDLDSTALGVEAKATNVSATSIGRIAQATEQLDSCRLGFFKKQQLLNQQQLVRNSQATGLDSTALGVPVKVGGVVSTALGDTGQQQKM